MLWIRIILETWIRIPHQGNKPDPDPHQNKKIRIRINHFVLQLILCEIKKIYRKSIKLPIPLGPHPDPHTKAGSALDPHQSEKLDLDPHPHQIKIRIRIQIRIKVISRIRIRIKVRRIHKTASPSSPSQENSRRNWVCRKAKRILLNSSAVLF